MKNIKDYLHLYIGCSYVSSDNIVRFLGVSNYCSLYHSCNGPSSPVLLLRRVNNMTRQEAIDLVSLYNDEDGVAEFVESLNRPFNTLGQIRKNGVDAISFDNLPMSTNFDVVRFLLSRQYDIFGLIDDGIAIDEHKYFNP